MLTNIPEWTPLFWEVFNKLPVEVRDSINALWATPVVLDEESYLQNFQSALKCLNIKESEFKAPAVLIAPKLLTTLSLAHVLLKGRILVFHYSMLRAPKHIIQTLIAHELGHVYQWAIGKRQKKKEDSERQVAKFIADWGYNNGDIQAWADMEEAFYGALAA